MTPEEFDEVLANLSAGVQIDAKTLQRFVEEAVRITRQATRLSASLAQVQKELDELRRGLDALGKVWQ
jgi:hypothetical protein